MLLDLELDPLTRDIIDHADGGAVEADDSRTAVLFQLTERAGEGCLGETTGSRIGALLDREEPTSAEELRDAALDALQALVAEGVISDLSISIGEANRPGLAVLELGYTDVASNRRVPLLLVPFGGVS
jgi:hypothetical protein